MNTELIKLEADEEVIKTVRKHWFILASRTIGLLFAALMPLIFIISWTILQTETPLLASIHVGGSTISFLTGAWLMLIWMSLAKIWTDYYLDMWIVTNRRLITINQFGFFRRSVSSFRFERLQDITVEINGFIETMLDFGRLSADTAGHESFIITGIPNPRSIKALILEYADAVVHAPIPKEFLDRGPRKPPEEI